MSRYQFRYQWPDFNVRGLKWLDQLLAHDETGRMFQYIFDIDWAHYYLDYLKDRHAIVLIGPNGSVERVWALNDNGTVNECRVSTISNHISLERLFRQEIRQGKKRSYVEQTLWRDLFEIINGVVTPKRTVDLEAITPKVEEEKPEERKEPANLEERLTENGYRIRPPEGTVVTNEGELIDIKLLFESRRAIRKKKGK
jgi:hypothetical protein